MSAPSAKPAEKRRDDDNDDDDDEVEHLQYKIILLGDGAVGAAEALNN